jgi:hypothetical protein
MPEGVVLEIKTKKDCSCKFSDTFQVKNNLGTYEVFVNKSRLFTTNNLDYIEEFFRKRAHLFDEVELNNFLNDLKKCKEEI